VTGAHHSPLQTRKSKPRDEASTENNEEEK